ncbi:MAG: alpha-glucan family phosphorylase [Desulfobia sp.]
MIAQNQWGTFFGVNQKTLDQVWGQLTSLSGNSCVYISMEIGSDRDVYDPVKKFLGNYCLENFSDRVFENLARRYMTGPEKIPNYSGGLGILAGDTLKSFADLKIPVVAISLLYRKGYFSQLVDSRLGQISTATQWQPANTPSLYLLKDPDNPRLPLEIEIIFYDQNDREILARAQLWLKMEINKDLDFFVPEILLDFCIPYNPENICQVCQRLYDSVSEEAKATQRRLLGASIKPVMHKLGLTAFTFHLNEQHGITVILQLISEYLENKIGSSYQVKATDQDILEAASSVARQIVYTIHTPVKAGHDRFKRSVISRICNSFCIRVLHLLALDQKDGSLYNFTKLAMLVNRTTNSVSRLHKEVTCKQFPEFKEKITAITNGIHHLTWISEARAAFYDSIAEFKGWRDNPTVFARALDLKDEKSFRKGLEKAWHKDTRRLIDFIDKMFIEHRVKRDETWIDPPNYISLLDEDDCHLDPKVFTIGFARRFSAYKRADLIFDNINTLADIVVSNNYPVNFIFAGKAHPRDEIGKALIKRILDVQEDLYKKTRGLAKLVFITGYDMKIAKTLVSGVHAWLNTPKRPLEASGTSGIKAALNGVPNISTLDGWWAEGYHQGKAGWKFGHETPITRESLNEDKDRLLYKQDAASFYQLLPDILQCFYKPDCRREFMDKAVNNIALNCPIFNTHRMAAEYVQRYKLLLPEATEKRLAEMKKSYQSDTYIN